MCVASFRPGPRPYECFLEEYFLCKNFNEICTIAYKISSPCICTDRRLVISNPCVLHLDICALRHVFNSYYAKNISYEHRAHFLYV